MLIIGFVPKRVSGEISLMHRQKINLSARQIDLSKNMVLNRF
jgi:hypothetical protein